MAGDMAAEDMDVPIRLLASTYAKQLVMLDSTVQTDGMIHSFGRFIKELSF
jgi:hypothetical protein